MNDIVKIKMTFNSQLQIVNKEIYSWVLYKHMIVIKIEWLIKLINELILLLCE